MDAFEDVVASFLRNRGHWVESCFKVKLDKAEKVEIGRPSSPRWELDLLAYRTRDNELMVIECKSFLDSTGVGISSFGENLKSDRYKLFNEPKLREVVFSRLAKQLEEQGAILPSPRIQLCLAAGRIKSTRDRKALHELFHDQGWRLFDEEWLREEMGALSKESYQNSITSVVAKLLLRGRDI